MMWHHNFLILFFLFQVTFSASGPKQVPPFLTTETILFSYGGTEQTQFANFPKYCKSGSSQSPIDINEPIIPDPEAKLIISPSFKTARIQEILINTGHKPQLVDLPSSPKKLIKFKGETYQYSNRHYHFGTNNNEGSPHALKGQKFPLEAHTIFFNTKYADVSNAINYGDGLLVLVQLYQIGDRGATFEILLNNIKNIVYPNQTIAINTGTALTDLIPLNSNFFYYQGSLSEPKCSESVTYVIFDKIQTLSANQMNLFRNVLRTPSGELLVKNWRFLQPRNGRKIYYSTQSVPSAVELDVDQVFNLANGLY